MGISKAWRLGGFIAALGASGALIAAATGSTGAYFTNTHDGSLKASSGSLTLSVSGTTSLDFSNLMPGATPTTESIGYTTHVSGGTEDVWLVFPAGTAYELFTGAKDDGVGGGLGRYGYFAVSDSNFGQAFRSHNLSFDPTPSDGPSCTVDTTTGRGGSDDVSTGPDEAPAHCGVPKAILLAWNLADGSTGNIGISFGISGRWTAQNASVANVPFQIVATQHGVSPNAPNF